MATTRRQHPPRPLSKKKVSKKKVSTKKPSPKPTGKGWLGRRPFFLVAYGPSGIGKTSFGANFPNAGFIHDPTEKGIIDLQEFNLVPTPKQVWEAESFSGLIKQTELVAKKRYGLQTLVFDALTGMELLCFHEHCDEYFDGDWSSSGFYSYGKGPANAATKDWPRFLAAIEEVREAGINVLLLGHSQIKPFNDPNGPEYDRYIPKLHKDIWAASHKDAQAVLFMGHSVQIDKKASKGKLKDRPKIDDERYFHMSWSPAYVAKNRFGIEEDIPMGTTGKEAYDNFREVMQRAGK